MPIKNYRSESPASKSIQLTQDALVAHGATDVWMEYEKGTGRIAALKFALEYDGKKVGFRIPTNWRAFQAVLKEQRVSRANDDDYAYRVAWANIRDWVASQMAFYETQMVTMLQVFLPYAVTNDGTSTLYDRVLTDGRLLGAPNDET